MIKASVMPVKKPGKMVVFGYFRKETVRDYGVAAIVFDP
jgi:hypothetical protein